MDIFVGNLCFAATEEDLKKLFADFGEVVSAMIIKEKNNTKSRGFGFVRMAREDQGLAAIAALNARDFLGRQLNVSISQPKPEKKTTEKNHKRPLPETRPEKKEYHGQKNFGKDRWFSPVFRSVEGDRKRRSRRRAAGGRGTEERPERRFGLKEKESFSSKSRLERDEKPRRAFGAPAGQWRKPGGEGRPWHKPGNRRRVWNKTETGIKPGFKPEARLRSRSNPEEEVNPRRRPEGQERIWRRPDGRGKPWIKTGERSKNRPWEKPEAQSQPWGKKPGSRIKKERVFSRKKKTGSFK